MGQVYDLPVVNFETLMTTGLIVGTRIIRNKLVRFGGSVAGFKAVFFNSDNVLYKYSSPSFQQNSPGCIVYYPSLKNFYAEFGTVSEEVGIYSLEYPSYYSRGYVQDICFYVNGNSADVISFGDYVEPYSTTTEAANALGISIANPCLITYSFSNSTVTGPPEAEVGDTVTVSAVPDVGYGITDASTQILVTNNANPVPYTWNPATNTITFTMPDPS